MNSGVASGDTAAEPDEANCAIQMLSFRLKAAMDPALAAAPSVPTQDQDHPSTTSPAVCINPCLCQLPILQNSVVGTASTVLT